MDAPSAMFMVAASPQRSLVLSRVLASEPVPAGSVLNWRISPETGLGRRLLAVLACVNATIDFGLQPVSVKFGSIDRLDRYRLRQMEFVFPHRRRRLDPAAAVSLGAVAELPGGVLIEQRELTIDGMAGTSMPRFSDVPGAMDYLRYDVTNLAYYARHTGRSAVIGVGSGRDLLSAYLFGFREHHRCRAQSHLRRPADRSGQAARLRRRRRPARESRFVVDDGRSWFARTQEKFDLIEMSMVDTWAATGAGAFSLSENGLYTVEGWKTFLSALSPNGLFTVSRWHSPTPPSSSAVSSAWPSPR